MTPTDTQDFQIYSLFVNGKGCCIRLSDFFTLFKDRYKHHKFKLLKRSLKKHLKEKVNQFCGFQLYVRDTLDIAYVKPLIKLNTNWTDVDKLKNLFVIGSHFTFNDAKSMFMYLYDCQDFPFEEDEFFDLFIKDGAWKRRDKPFTFPNGFSYSEESMRKYFKEKDSNYIKNSSDFAPLPLHSSTREGIESWQQVGLTDDEMQESGTYCPADETDETESDTNASIELLSEQALPRPNNSKFSMMYSITSAVDDSRTLDSKFTISDPMTDEGNPRRAPNRRKIAEPLFRLK
eukprot:NODE_447_length_8464_cov_0.381112.p5 type:complete len:289 gc:universal NODE_447_length_8464_cov_0.381112:1686-2552(+)